MPRCCFHFAVALVTLAIPKAGMSLSNTASRTVGMIVCPTCCLESIGLFSVSRRVLTRKIGHLGDRGAESGEARQETLDFVAGTGPQVQRASFPR